MAAPSWFFLVSLNVSLNVARNVSLNSAVAHALRYMHFRETGGLIPLTALWRVTAHGNCAWAFAAGAGFPCWLRRVLCARWLHLRRRFCQHRVGFLGGNWTIDKEIEPVVTHFRWPRLMIDDGDRPGAALAPRLASTLQQEARLRLVGPVHDHARKVLLRPFFDGRKNVGTDFNANLCTLAARRECGVRLGAFGKP